ncbi:hypothetical protein N8772_03020 [Rickettsiales bacterium]|nr:hypothetical protein [Rickettsiales bacterium]MDB2550769.1 hypothetical protein [Rickettsiales bacterium]
MPEKPTGNIGPIKIEVKSNSVKDSWEIINFPKEKREIENKIIKKFRYAGEEAGFVFNDIKENNENHYDYTLTLPGGEVYLDLMEIIYKKSNQKGSPYEKDHNWIKNGYYAEQILNQIFKKSNKYQDIGNTPKHLLTYVTHYNFSINENTIIICQNELRKRRHVFENIFFLDILDDTNSKIRVLYPMANNAILGDSKLNELKNLSYLNLDPKKWSLIA